SSTIVYVPVTGKGSQFTVPSVATKPPVTNVEPSGLVTVSVSWTNDAELLCRLSRCPAVPLKVVRARWPGRVMFAVTAEPPTSSAALEDGIDMVTPDPPTVTRPVDATSVTPKPSGGTKKSSALAAESAGVAIDSRPEVAPYGTVVAIEVLVTVPTSASVRLKRRRLFVVGDVTK